MRVLELARRRKTVRSFLPDKPPREDILKALKVAKEAPSGMNAQPWRFVVIDDDWLKGKIRELCEREEEKFYSRTKGDLMAWLNAKGFKPEKPVPRRGALSDSRLRPHQSAVLAPINLDCRRIPTPRARRARPRDGNIHPAQPKTS